MSVAALDRTLMPWIIASQTIPILAIAPMVVVVLGSMGIIGLVPKATISTYLCFFPVVVGMVKGNGGKLNVNDYQRTVDTLLASDSDPVINSEPVGAWTHKVWDAAFGS